MAAISYDGQSFIIEGRRVWLVSGTVHYARLPRELWRARLVAAKHAGLNCIETAVVWNLHEPHPGEFRFEGNSDLRHFVELVNELDMWCILRVGPFVGDGWDMGGLPAWLMDLIDEARNRREEDASARLRENSPSYLQAAARYIDAVMKQVKDLQASAQQPGPILLVQNEHEWVCQNDEQAEGYLQQINRFLRESGCDVPLINRNNLWQQVQGTISTWAGERHLFTASRQLRLLQPLAPSMAMNVATSEQPVWGEEHAPEDTPRDVLKRIVGASAAGSMINLNPAVAGAHPAFFGGRLDDDLGGFVTQAYAPDAPIDQTGRPGPSHGRVRRICTFLAQFETLMAHLRPDDHHTVAATDLSVVQRSGTQGHAVFMTRDPGTEPREIELITPDGQTLPVDLGEDRLAWIVLDANLDGVAQLELTNLRPWAFHQKKLLVLFGPAGSTGITVIDGTHLECVVPADDADEPVVMPYDDLTVVVLSEGQVDHAYLHDDGLYLNVDGIDAANQPITRADGSGHTLIALDGEASKSRKTKVTRPTAPRLGAWEYAGIASYVDGTAPRYATLEGPRSLEQCAADLGYGWYRIRLNRSRGKKANLLIPRGADRLHLYHDGKLLKTVGTGPGASADASTVSIPGGESDIIVLADNLGRFSGGLGFTMPKGLAGHLLDVKAIRLTKPDIEDAPRINPFDLAGFVPGCTVDDRGLYPQYTWKINLTTNKPEPLVLHFHGPRPRSVITINNRAVGIDVGCGADHYVVLDEFIKKGANRLTLGLIDHPEEGDVDLADCLNVYQIAEVLTADAEWYYAKWQLPNDNEYGECPKTTPASPAFYRSTFKVKDTSAPLMLHIATATKGQVYLNGHNLGRYFVATSTGRKVPPQSDYYLPEPYLNADGDNDLILFDEHGRIPKCKLSYV
ncbi:MAG: hypothetical protein GC159_21785 [Phycisphaera sp.]|nr:hypothetical protein [Phycisphaera sp.]